MWCGVGELEKARTKADLVGGRKGQGRESNVARLNRILTRLVHAFNCTLLIMRSIMVNEFKDSPSAFGRREGYQVVEG